MHACRVTRGTGCRELKLLFMTISDSQTWFVVIAQTTAGRKILDALLQVNQ